MDSKYVFNFFTVLKQVYFTFLWHTCGRELLHKSVLLFFYADTFWIFPLDEQVGYLLIYLYIVHNEVSSWAFSGIDRQAFHLVYALWKQFTNKSKAMLMNFLLNVFKEIRLLPGQVSMKLWNIIAIGNKLSSII